LHPHGAGTYNQQRHLWVELRGSDLIYYDLSGQGRATGRIFNNRIVYASAADQGTFDFGAWVWPAMGDRFGLEYDPIRDRYLLWDGVRDIWELKAPDDLENGNWILTRLTPGVGGTSYPDRIADSVLNDNGYYQFVGVAGKWDYIPEWDVFLGVYHPVEGDVWAFKPLAAASTEVPEPPALPLLLAAGLAAWKARRWTSDRTFRGQARRRRSQTSTRCASVNSG